MSQKINPIAFRLGVKKTWLDIRDPISNSLEKHFNLDYVNFMVRKLITGIFKQFNFIPSEIHIGYKSNSVIKVTFSCWNSASALRTSSLKENTKEVSKKKTLSTILTLVHLILSIRFPKFKFRLHVLEVPDYSSNAEILSTHVANSIAKSPMQFKFILKNLALRKIQSSNS